MDQTLYKITGVMSPTKVRNTNIYAIKAVRKFARTITGEAVSLKRAKELVDDLVDRNIPIVFAVPATVADLVDCWLQANPDVCDWLSYERKDNPQTHLANLQEVADEMWDEGKPALARSVEHARSQLFPDISEMPDVTWVSPEYRQ